MIDSLGNWRRSNMCGELSGEDCGRKVVLMGWVQRRRDLGGLIFVDLRDRSGIVQLSFSPDLPQEAFAKGEALRSEYVIAVRGEVRLRPEGQANPNMKTGEIEVWVEDIRILNAAKTPPFYIVPEVDTDESLRLKYRYLDLRRPDIQTALIQRHHITAAVRDYLNNHGFIEVETPILTKSTPEGARDYLVPSRVNPGAFYALPQSPQLFKQLLMVAGLDRYYQIARCFRDEDLRADRQPEFTQIDIEMSFVDEEDVQELAEGMVRYVFNRVLGVDLGSSPFRRITYQEAMEKYGTDKPDLRFGMELYNLTDIVKDSSFRVFKNTVERGGQVKGLVVGQGVRLSRKEIDQLTDFVKRFGAKGLAWIALESDKVRSPIAKFLSEAELTGICKRLQARTGDLILMVADTPSVASRALGELRVHLANKLHLIEENQWKLAWVVDFPLFEYVEEEGRYVAAHHPFTMPKAEDIELMLERPELVRAKAYDLVLNGSEIGGGSIRISHPEVQRKMFAAIGLSESEAQEKFGFFIEALQYGTPPHGGIAFGLDRLVMEITGRHNIRDVIAFPKTTSASCLMTGAPSSVSQRQLEELRINLTDSQ